MQCIALEVRRQAGSCLPPSLGAASGSPGQCWHPAERNRTYKRGGKRPAWHYVQLRAQGAVEAPESNHKAIAERSRHPPRRAFSSVQKVLLPSALQTRLHPSGCRPASSPPRVCKPFVPGSRLSLYQDYLGPFAPPPTTEKAVVGSLPLYIPGYLCAAASSTWDVCFPSTCGT